MWVACVAICQVDLLGRTVINSMAVDIRLIQWNIREKYKILIWIEHIDILDVFAKLWKYTFCFVLSVCLSVCSSMLPHRTAWLPLTDVYEISYVRIFWKYIEKIQVWLKSDRIMSTFHKDLCTLVITFCWILFRMRNVLDKVAEKIKIHILFLVTLLNKECHSWNSVGKSGRARHATDDNTVGRMHIA
jgi:hypothetical protein